MTTVIDTLDESQALDPPIPIQVPVLVAEPQREEVLSPILTRLLQMADVYLRQGAPKQAIEMYFQLVEVHGPTPEGRQAHDRLMEVAADYESQGQLRQARSIYERLL
jgi:tetratricopeptide (TPR) repeat protein